MAKKSFVTALNGGFSAVDPDLLGIMDPTKLTKLVNMDYENEQLVRRGGLQTSHAFPTGAHDAFGFYIYRSDTGAEWELLFALNAGETPTVYARGASTGSTWTTLTTSDAATIPQRKPDITTFAGVCFIAFPGRALYTFDGGSVLNAQVLVYDTYSNEATVPTGQYFTKAANRLFLVGGPAGRTVYFTEPNTNFWKYLEQPDPELDDYTDPINVPENHITIQSSAPITSIAEYKGSILLFTDDEIFEWSWSDLPDEGQIRRIPSNVGSISHWATQIFQNKLLFAWYDGVYSWNGAVIEKESRDLDDYIESFSKGPMRFQYWGEENSWLGWSHTSQEVNEDGRLILASLEQTVEYTSGDDTEHSIARTYVWQTLKVSKFSHQFCGVEAKLHYLLSQPYGPNKVRCYLDIENTNGELTRIWKGEADLHGEDETTEWVEFIEYWRNPHWKKAVDNLLPSQEIRMTLYTDMPELSLHENLIQYYRWRAHTAGTYADGQSSESSSEDQLFKFHYKTYATSGSSNSPPINAHDASTWGIFEAFIPREPTGSTITFYYRHASTEAGLTGGWTNINEGSTPSPGTNKWLQFRIVLTRGTIGKTPEVAAIKVTWYTGADNPMDICDAWIFDDKYFINWKSGSGFYALILDAQGRWRIWEWVLIEGAVEKGILLGVSGTSVIKYNTAYTLDLGSPFSIIAWTSKWAQGNPFIDKTYRSILLGIEGTQVNSIKVETNNDEMELANTNLSGDWLEESLSDDVVGRSARIKIEGVSSEISAIRAVGLLYEEHELRRR